MSSWLSLSLPNPFKSDESQSSSPPPQTTTKPSNNDDDDGDHCPSGGGVKEDLSVLGQTIGRQLLGVAAFLAPPPTSPTTQPPPSHSAAAEEEDSSSQAFVGIKNDLVEIGGSFKSGLSILSPNNAVSGISRFASNLLQFQNQGDEVEEDEDDEDSGVAGVTEEVLDFVQEISLRPELWTDFPSSLDNDFVMSDMQREHASIVEHLVPSLAASRQKVLSNLSDEQFWMIYFILLLPRLSEHDFKLLSTPEITYAREILLQKLQNKKNASVETSEDLETVVSSQQGGKSPVQGKEVSSGAVNTPQGMEKDNQKNTKSDDHENLEQWLNEQDVNTCTSSVHAQKQPDTEDDVSFSDLEDDDNDLSGRPSGFRPARTNQPSSPSGSNEWIQLDKNSETRGDRQKSGQSTSQAKDSEGEESNDWLTVDDVDF